MNIPEPAVPESVRVAIAATPTLHPDDDHFAAIDEAAEPMCAVLFAEHSEGRLVDQDDIARRLIERDGLDLDSRFVHRFRDTMARHAEAGDARFTIESKMLFKSQRAVLAAAGFSTTSAARDLALLGFTSGTTGNLKSGPLFMLGGNGSRSSSLVRI